MRHTGKKEKALDNIMTPSTRPHKAAAAAVVSVVAAAAAVISFLKCYEAPGIYKARQMSMEGPSTW